jgi:hypothetical protein
VRLLLGRALSPPVRLLLAASAQQHAPVRLLCAASFWAGPSHPCASFWQPAQQHAPVRLAGAAPGKAAPRRAVMRCLAAAALNAKSKEHGTVVLRPGHGARPRALGHAATARPALSLSQRSRLMKAFEPRAGWQLIKTAGLKLGSG